MLTLLTYPAGFGQFSLSPFCVKAAMLLQVSGERWQREDMDDPRGMPFGKLPVLRTEERLVADSDMIRKWLEDRGASFDPGLDPVQAARSRALIRMAEEHLYFHVVLDRWASAETWPVIREAYFHAIPALIRRPVTSALRKTVLKGLAVQGLGRLSPAQRMERIEPDLTALSVLLREASFLLGAAPTAADFSVSPILAAMRATPVDTALVARVRDDAVLSAYLDRMTEAVPLQ